MNKYIVTLEGQGDHYSFFIDPIVYKWATSYDADPPQSVIDAYTKVEQDEATHYGTQQPPSPQDVLKELKGTSGSWVNDRMLMLLNFPNTKLYHTILSVHEAIKANKYNVLGEYSGYVY